MVVVVVAMCSELIYKEVVGYESPERHSRTRGSSNSVQNHTSGVNHNSGMIKQIRHKSLR